jgi:hypothetical protein
MGILSSLMSKNFPSLVIGAITTAALRLIVVQVLGSGQEGVCTFSVTTSKWEFVKFFSLETVFQPSLSLTSLPRFTFEIVGAAVLSRKIFRA